MDILEILDTDPHKNLCGSKALKTILVINLKNCEPRNAEQKTFFLKPVLRIRKKKKLLKPK